MSLRWNSFDWFNIWPRSTKWNDLENNMYVCMYIYIHICQVFFFAKSSSINHRVYDIYICSVFTSSICCILYIYIYCYILYIFIHRKPEQNQCASDVIIPYIYILIYINKKSICHWHCNSRYIYIHIYDLLKYWTFRGYHCKVRFWYSSEFYWPSFRIF